MIVITGAAGFIGSVVATAIQQQSDQQLVLVDDFSKDGKHRNHSELQGVTRVERAEFFDWLQGHQPSFVVHLGARTDTTEFDHQIFDELNVSYSQRLWNYCAENGVPLIYASSAATYGGGEHGYADDHQGIGRLEPLNPYGASKQTFDEWALDQDVEPPHWYGLKFFNVYGPNEYHKGRMASVVLHAYRQISESGELKLFRSHNPEFKDGEQLRDFIYVKDIASVIEFLMEHQPESGIYNLGTGQARTFLDLGKAVFEAMDKEPVISFIDTPVDIRDKYQYYTQAEMQKLRDAGYSTPFTTLEEGVNDYVTNYLMRGAYYRG